MLCSGGHYDTESDALSAVNGHVLSLPAAASWQVIETTRTVVQFGDGTIRRPGAPVRSDRERWSPGESLRGRSR